MKELDEALELFRRDRAAGVTRLEQLVAQYPSRVDLLYSLGEAYRRTGQKKLAEGAWSRAAILKPDDEVIRQSLDMLRRSSPPPPDTTVSTASNSATQTQHDQQAFTVEDDEDLPAMNDIFIPKTKRELEAWRKRDLAKQRANIWNDFIAKWTTLPTAAGAVFGLLLTLVIVGGLIGAGVWAYQRYVVAYPNEMITVPDIRGLNTIEAGWRLDDAGLMRTAGGLAWLGVEPGRRVEEVVKDETLGAGLVTGTKPAAGEVVKRNTDIVIYVADPIGPPGSTVAVPDVTGLEGGTAYSRLLDAGLNSEFAPGSSGFESVVRTDPVAGTQVLPIREGSGSPRIVIYTE